MDFYTSLIEFKDFIIDRVCEENGPVKGSAALTKKVGERVKAFVKAVEEAPISDIPKFQSMFFTVYSTFRDQIVKSHERDDWLKDPNNTIDLIIGDTGKDNNRRLNITYFYTKCLKVQEHATRNAHKLEDQELLIFPQIFRYFMYRMFYVSITDIEERRKVFRQFNAVARVIDYAESGAAGEASPDSTFSTIFNMSKSALQALGIDVADGLDESKFSELFNQLINNKELHNKIKNLFGTTDLKELKNDLMSGKFESIGKLLSSDHLKDALRSVGVNEELPDIAGIKDALASGDKGQLIRSIINVIGKPEIKDALASAYKEMKAQGLDVDVIKDVINSENPVAAAEALAKEKLPELMREVEKVKSTVAEATAATTTTPTPAPAPSTSSSSE